MIIPDASSWLEADNEASPVPVLPAKCRQKYKTFSWWKKIILLNLKKEEENKIENGGQKSSASIQKSLKFATPSGS